MPVCDVCLGPLNGHKAMCISCCRSYDRHSNAGGGSVYDAIVWAARRGRRTLLARQKAARSKRPR